MLSESDVKEQISYAYLHALSASVRLSCERPHIDRDSVDAEVCARGFVQPDSLVASAKLAVQLKATSVPKVDTDETFEFRLKIKNYDDLRRRSMVPHLLVVLELPTAANDWVTHDENSLVTRKCAYWLNLLDSPEATQLTKVPVIISRNNVLTQAALTLFIELASKRRDLPYAL